MPEGELVEWYVAGGQGVGRGPLREGSGRAGARAWVREEEHGAAGAEKAVGGRGLDVVAPPPCSVLTRGWRASTHIESIQNGKRWGPGNSGRRRLWVQ